MRSARRISGFLALLIGILLLPYHSLAHTGLDRSSPAKDEIIAEQLQEVVLQFNTNIEEASRITLLKAGEEIAIAKTLYSGKTMTAQLEQSLSDGDYEVQWSIIGADGHRVKGSYTFKVSLPEPPQSPPPAAETTAPSASPSTPPPSASPSVAPTVTPSPSSPASAPASPTPIASPSAPADTSEPAGWKIDKWLSYALIGAAGILLITLIIRRFIRKGA